MTTQEAFSLMGRRFDTPPGEVTISRNGGTWRGKPVGIVTVPSMILEVDGQRVVIAIEGAEEVHDEL